MYLDWGQAIKRLCTAFDEKRPRPRLPFAPIKRYNWCLIKASKYNHISLFILCYKFTLCDQPVFSLVQIHLRLTEVIYCQASFVIVIVPLSLLNLHGSLRLPV